MSDLAIRVEGLGKQYRLGAAAARHDDLRSAIAAAFTAPLRNLRALRGLGAFRDGEEAGSFWALRDVSFELRHGETLGIIGRNGAGKSTLLKILSRIVTPTTGRAAMNGRVGSLLEVGTGFHPELTGRDNIYLNGSILGMDRRYIERRFDEIVDFAGVASFLDTPVKRYSSGMYMRLAFAVAAHLEPEILIVDEVLAVGDAQFQKKCLGKMNEVSREGRTVLFVSHNMGAVQSLCRRSVLLHGGRVFAIGETREVVAQYLDRDNGIFTPVTWHPIGEDRGEFVLDGVRVVQDGVATATVDCRRPFAVELEYEVRTAVPGARLWLVLRNERGEALFSTSDHDLAPDGVARRPPGRYRSEVRIPGNLLRTGLVHGTVGADVQGDRIVFTVDDALEIEVIDTELDPGERHLRAGAVAPVLPWRTDGLGDRSGAAPDRRAGAPEGGAERPATAPSR
jgi:lipopolysaccharide transport system ATP-binding protein